MRYALILAAVFAIPAASVIAQEESVEIPLKEIWARDMPGTRDIRVLDQDGEHSSDDSLADRIVRSPNFRSTTRRTEGFAVAGAGLDALKAAHGILVEEAAPPNPIPAEREVTLVFFSQEFNCYVHLKSVERRDKEVIITYSFVPHLTKELTAHFALIPLGQLSSGEWHVEVVQAPMSDKHRKAGFNPISTKVARKVVSQSFAFEVVDDK